MRILIDTNIIIPLEDSSKVLGESFGELVRLATEHQHQLVVHPSSLEDIRRDTDENRRKISLSRIRKYPVLENPPVLNKSELDRLGLTQADENDRIDNEILYAIYRDAANLLVTEDRGIHKKAEVLGLGDRVHYIQEATEFLEHLHAKVRVSLPNIEEVFLHQIDLKDDIFDSVRGDYPDFDEWYKRVSREGRKAWIYRADSSKLGAIAIYKDETDPIVTNDDKALRGKALKLCTFKVGEEVQGRKIGELFLKAAFRYAAANKIEHIYITMRPGKYGLLEDLCVDFGFYRLGKYKLDDVYIKDHPIKPPSNDLKALEYHKRYYPHFRCGASQNKYVVPIIPEYHEILFPDMQKQPSLFTYSPAGNAIKQAYLCHAKIRGISPGDTLLFYRSHDLQAITSIGIVESVQEYKDPDKIMELVSKRTVYSYEEIVRMTSKKTKVILFRLAAHISKSVSYEWLLKKGVVNGIIYTIRKISHDSFKQIVDECEVCNCLFAD